MQLACPDCNTPVSAQNINIQEMLALCSACASVFDIAPQRRKLKRRKVRQPKHLRLREDGQSLRLAFRTNFRLEKNENFTGSAVCSAVFTLVGLLMTSLYLEGEVPLMLPVVFTLLSLGALYTLATIAYNTTEIVMNAQRLRVARLPLPSLSRPRTLDLTDIESISAEETAASQQAGYDTPRYHVWAQRFGGERKLIVGDLTEEYALFIAAQLDEYLPRADSADVSRLSQLDATDKIAAADAPSQSQNLSQGL